MVDDIILQCTHCGAREEIKPSWMEGEYVAEIHPRTGWYFSVNTLWLCPECSPVVPQHSA